MRRKEPGRVRWRLAEMLEIHGIIVSPYDLWTQEGAYRSVYWDLARWGSYHARWKAGQDPDGRPTLLEFHLSSWSTMSDCLRFGLSFGDDSGSIAAKWTSVDVNHCGITCKACGKVKHPTRPCVACRKRGTS